MIDPDETDPYRVEAKDGRFQIVDWEENVILVCDHLPSAEQYAVLMNQSFRRGFKAGIRKCREA